MTQMRNNLLIILAVIFLGGFIAGNTLAASEGGIGGTGSAANSKGIGGTGSPAMSGGIGGTGAPAMNSGIGGTGLRPDSETVASLAGKVLFVVGKVEAQNMGQTRTLTKGDSVRVGDTLKSGAGATLQIRMADGGAIVLRPESRLTIESFAYKGVQDGSEHLSLALLNGGFRAVTGEIGHLHKENYSISTPNAKVGILGTDHETVFVPATQAGQTAVLEPGTYNHVISGATVLQDAQGKLLIKPNQTGFAALNGMAPIILAKPLPIFGDLKANPGGDHHGDLNDTVKGSNGNAGSSEPVTGNEQSSRSVSTTGSSSGTEQNPSNPIPGTGQNSNGSTSGADQNSRNVSNTISISGTGQNSSDPTQSTQQNKITQTDNLSNTNLDLSTLETDASPAPLRSAVVGAHMAGGLQAVGSAQAGNPGVTLLVEDNMPSSYSNNATGFNFIANEGEPIKSGTAQVDGVTVTWGIYAGGTAFDTSGKAVTINYHSFAFANGGATPPSVVSSMSGNAIFSNIIGYTKPVTESGKLGGSVNLNVGINFGTATLTSYNLAVTDANSRNWTGTLNNGPVPLSTFAQNGTPLAVACGSTSCGSGVGSGSTAGMLIGPNAKGLISSYVLSTTTGQAVSGAAIISR